MAQQQIVGGLAALACYTVDSDFSSDEEGDRENNVVEKVEECKDFGDVVIKEEPLDIVEYWSVDTVGVRDPQDEVPEFMELQEVKVEIESEVESDSDSDSSSSESEEELDNKKQVVEKDEGEGGVEGPPRTKNEMLPKDLPPIEDLTMTVGETECQEVGEVSSIVEDLVVVESSPGLPALDLESVLFLEKGAKVLGHVFDVIGPVTRPYYVIRFNSEQHVKERGVTTGLKVYFAPKTEHTTFVFLEQLMKMKISDASWFNDEEPPLHFQEYSDDEQETRAKQEKKISKMVEKGADEDMVTAKKARFDQGRARQERGRGRGGTNTGNNRGGREGGGQPSYCNNMYTAQTNPFYRAERGYDPRACGGGQISWGQYNAQSQYYQYPQHGYPQYSTPPPALPSTTPQYSTTPSATPHHALAAASWQSQYQPSSYQQSTNQYQQITGNIARMQQPPLPPALSLPPPPPPPPQ